MAKPTFSFGSRSQEETKKKEEVKIMELKPEPVYTHEALGTFKNEDTGEWMVAVVKYNPSTKEAIVSESIPSGGGRDFVIEKFKIAAVHKGIVG